MQKNILKFSLLSLSFVVSFFAWLSVSNAITMINYSIWLVPMIWFSLVYILFSLEFILIPEKLWCGVSIMLGFFLSLFFVHNFWHIGFLFIASILLFEAYRQIKNDLNSRVRLCLPKNLQAGKTFFVLALAIAISSQYYFQAKAIGLLKLPTFDASVILNSNWTKEFLYKLSPDLQKMGDENLTILVNQKIQSLVSPNYANEKFPVIPISMAFILFLTILSLGAFMIRFLVHLVNFIFWILILTKVVSVKKIPVEMEVIG